MLQHSTCQHFGMDCKTTSLAKLRNEIRGDSDSSDPDFKISYTPRAQSGIPDSLDRTARSFHRELSFIGCSIPIWLPRKFQV